MKKKILTIAPGTTADDIKQRTGAKSVELLGDSLAIVEFDDGIINLSAEIDDPNSPIFNSEDDGEVHALETEDWRTGYREGFSDGASFGKASSIAPPLSFENTDEWTWGLQAVGVPGTAFSGRGIKVCVGDTGLATGHTDFRQRKIIGHNFSHSGESTDIEDRHGHGTHVSGTVCGRPSSTNGRQYGVAPDVELLVAKVLGDNGSGTFTGVLQSIYWAISQGCHVINFSLGGGTNPISAFEIAGLDAIRAGLLIVAAAGNDGKQSKVHAPANATWIMAVGALTPELKSASFSSPAGPTRMEWVDISAPGQSVISSSRNGGYSIMSGTSMASPHVAGLAALWLEKLGTSSPVRAAQIWRSLFQYAQPLEEPFEWVGMGCARVPF